MFSRKKNIIALLCGIVMLFSTFGVSANNAEEHQTGDKLLFSDITEDYWAYDAIKIMVDRKIVENSNGRFRPDDTITRAEFAKILTTALDITLEEPSKPIFKDIPKGNWAYKYVEAAKYYLTGFRTSGGDYFKPADAVLKEDMIVALVKALGYNNESADESFLNSIKDKEDISKNLKKYVSIALKHGIIKSEPIKNSDLSMLKPKESLSRASVAVLLCNILGEEKVTYDGNTDENTDLDEEESKDYVDNTTYAVPKVSVTVDKGKVLLKWQKIDDNKLQGYKVVISQTDSTPQYPENGYLYWITDKSRTYAYIDNSTAYNNGDFNGYLKAGEKYYLSITAVYDGLKVPGNTVYITYPKSSSTVDNEDLSRKVTSLNYKVDNGKLLLYWNKVSPNEFVYYKVVISKINTAPKYPDDGYLYYFTDVNHTSAVIDSRSCYNGGDISGYLKPGEEYYFSITAVYKDEKVPGVVSRIKFPE